MEPPAQLRSAANRHEEITIARRDYDGEQVIAIDFGPGVDATVDVLGETAIVVAGDQQFEFEVPGEMREITANDGVLLLRGDA